MIAKPSRHPFFNLVVLDASAVFHVFQAIADRLSDVFTVLGVTQFVQVVHSIAA